MVRLRIGKILSFPVGLVGGAALGGLSFGLTLGTLFAIAVPTGAIAMTDSMSRVDTWYEGFWLGMRGALFGALAGAVAGLVAGPVIGFTNDY